MATDADLALAEEGLARARAARLERERQEAAQQALSTPSPPPEEAARIQRDADRLGLPAWAFETNPDVVSMAESMDQAEALRANPRLSEWVSDPANAAVARDDLDVLGSLEQWWKNAQRDIRVMGQRQIEMDRRSQEAAQEQVREFERRIGTREGRQQTLRESQRAVRQMADQLSDPDWWKRQGDTAERNARNFVEGIGPFFEGVAEDWRVQPQQSDRIYEQSQLAWRALNGQATPVEMRRLAELEALQPVAPRTPVGYALQSYRMSVESVVSGLDRGTQFGSLGATVGAVGAAAGGQAGPQVALPEEILTVPGAMAAGFSIGMVWGVPYGAFEETARIEGGLAYSEFRQLRDENGRPIDDDVARMAAYAVAGVNGGLEIFSVRAILRSVPGADDMIGGLTRQRMRELLMRPSVRRALLRAARRLGSVGVTEGITEGMQEATLITAGEWAKDRDGGVFYRPTMAENIDRVRQAAWGGFQAGLVFGGASASVGLAIDVPRAVRANEDARFIESLGATAEASRLRRRLPARFRAAAEAITADGPLSSVYIDARAFESYYQSQGMDPAQVADALEGVGRAEYEAALEAGDDIAIPLSTFAARIAGTPQRQGLANHIRLRPDADTIAEAMAYGANQEYLESQIEELRDQQRLSDDALEAQQAIAQDVTRRLDVAGVTVSEHNRMVGEFVSLTIANIAKRSGKNPIELYRRYMTRILGPYSEGESKVPSPQAEINEQPQLDPAAFAAETMRRHGLADLRLTLDEKTGDLSLDIIALERKAQKRGAGSAAMRDIIEYADRNGLRIVANPLKRGGAYGTRSRGAVADFLKRFGFVENTGDARDASTGATMYRMPTGKTQQAQAEPITSERRFDTRAVSGDLARAGPVPIPDVGTPEFAALLEIALAKSERGLPLSFLEQYVLGRARSGTGAVSVASEGYLQGDEPIRAGPLPPRRAHIGTAAIPPARPQDRPVGPTRVTVRVGPEAVRGANPADGPSAPSVQLSPEQAALLRKLKSERDRLVREIEQRMENERDLPEMETARRDAEAMRSLAYCAARHMARGAATVAAVGGAAGATLATAGAGAVLSPSEVEDGTLPPGYENPDMPRGEPPREVVPVPQEPAPVQLPEQLPEEAISALTADQAAEAEAPPSLSQASAEAALADTDLPIVTANEAQRPQ